jgi:hypothetical protein
MIACATSDDVSIYDVTTIPCATSDDISIYDVTTIAYAISDDISIYACYCGDIIYGYFI